MPQVAMQREYDQQMAILNKRYETGTISLEDYQTAVENAWNALNKVEFDKKAKEAAEFEKALKGNEEAFHSLEERLDPTIKASRDYANNQEILNKALANGQVSTTEYTRLMGLLGTEYTKSQRGVDQWAEFTEGAVDRVDEAFASSWANITDGFGGFAKNLKNAFLQLLGELAHMAITKPIIMQIGAALGVGGLSGAANASGLFGSGAGGFSLDSLYSMGTGAYKFLTGTGSQALSAFQTGGFGGLLDMGKGALSGLFSSGTGSTAAGYANVSNFMATPTGSVNGLFGSGLSAGATGLAGLGGALYGYGKSGLKGAATGGAGAVGGALLGNMLLPGIGGIIGSALGGFLGGGLFGGKWQTKDVGLSLGVSGGGLDAQQYEYQKKKGGIFGGSKKRTRYSDLDDATQSALDATFDNLASTSQDIFTKLGIQVGDGALDGLNIAATQISTKDKSEEEIQQAITQWFTGVGDQMVTAINDATGQKLSGVVINGGLNLTGVTELANNLYIINDILDSLRLTSQALTVDGALANQALMNLAGGMDALKANTAAYYQGFFTEAERNQDTVDAVRKQFQALNITMPETRESFRAAVEALDLTTAAGQDMFTKLTGLAGTAAAAYTILEQNTAASKQAAETAQQNLMTDVTDAFTALQNEVSRQQQTLTNAYNTQLTELNGKVTTVTDSVQGLTNVSTSLKNALKQLTGQSDDAVKTLRAQAQATLQSALSTARAGGSLAGFDLSDALSTVSETNSNLYASYEDMARDQGRTANVVAELNGYADKQLTTEEQALKSLQDQIRLAKDNYEQEAARLDALVDFGQAQIDALNGINNSVLSLNDLIANMNRSVSAAAPTGTGTTNSSNLISSAYQSAGITMDAAGAAYWQAQLASGALNSSNIGEAIRNAAVQNGQIPAFASGGDHLGGLRLVGENGPELEVTGPSRIYNNSDTMKMLGGNNDAVVAQLIALRQENKDMKSALIRSATELVWIKKQLRQWNDEGMPEEREEVATT
ncbi:hypothetical protein VPH49_24210 [Pseudomonas luteola]|uniref:hypothetical protein n=1 Tax=Pseudomonas luteola TaxID=47886 RepID=UPI003A864DA6